MLHCTLWRKDSLHECTGSAWAERVGQGEVGEGDIHMLGLAVKESWFGPMGHLSPWLDGQAYKTLLWVNFCQGRLFGLWAEVWQLRELTIACSWLRSWVCLLMLKVDLGTGLKTEIEIWCIKGMCMLKVVWSEKNLGFVAVPGRNQTLFHCIFARIAAFEALLRETSVKGHTCWVNLSIPATFTQCVWAPPLMEILRYSTSNAAMQAKYTTE